MTLWVSWGMRQKRDLGNLRSPGLSQSHISDHHNHFASVNPLLLMKSFFEQICILSSWSVPKHLVTSSWLLNPKKHLPDVNSGESQLISPSGTCKSSFVTSPYLRMTRKRSASIGALGGWSNDRFTKREIPEGNLWGQRNPVITSWKRW